MSVAFVPAPDLLWPTLVLTGLWCLTSCTLVAASLLRRLRDAPPSATTALLALAALVALPATTLLALGASGWTSAFWVLTLHLAATVGLLLATAALRAVERRRLVVRSGAEGAALLRRRVHPAWAALPGLVVGATALQLGAAWAPASPGPLRTLGWLVGLPALLVLVQTVRRSARDAQRAQAGAPPAPAPLATWLRTAADRLVADVLAARDAPVPAEVAGTQLGHAATVAAAVAAPGLVLGVLQVLVSGHDPVGAAILLGATGLATCGVALAVAPWALTGVRTAWRLRRQGPEPAGEPDPA